MAVPAAVLSKKQQAAWPFAISLMFKRVLVPHKGIMDQSTFNAVSVIFLFIQSFLALLQIIGLVITIYWAVRYTNETSSLRQSANDQADATNQQLELARKTFRDLQEERTRESHPFLRFAILNIPMRHASKANVRLWPIDIVNKGAAVFDLLIPNVIDPDTGGSGGFFTNYLDTNGTVQILVPISGEDQPLANGDIKVTIEYTTRLGIGYRQAFESISTLMFPAGPPEPVYLWRGVEHQPNDGKASVG